MSRIFVCDLCKQSMEKGNRVHIYNNTSVRSGKGNRPLRKDYDICNSCKNRLLKIFEGGSK